MLTKNQFVLLNYCRNNIYTSQRNLADKLDISLGTVNAVLSECRNNGWLTESSCVTELGYEVLAPFKVENAIIMAAGMSSRFASLSYEKPKGLFVVKGEILIERQIRQLQAVGIKDIVVVVGYWKEQFFYLEDKFGVSIIVNDDYYRYNNTSTLMKVIDKLGNTYICSSDNYFTENIFEEYVYQAYYSAIYSNLETDEYCITTNNSGKITKVSVGSGTDAWYMFGPAYFSREFSNKFAEILKREYHENPIVKNLLWEQLYMRYLKELVLYIRKYDDGIIKEFDSLDELQEFDEHYVYNTNSEIIDNICKVFKCESKDIVEIHAIKDGVTNTSFCFKYEGKKYVYRHSATEANGYIHRGSENFSMKVAQDLELDDTFIYMDAEKGWKLSHYIENAQVLDYHNEDEVRCVLKMLRKLHDTNIKSPYDFDVWNKILDFIKRASEKGRNDFAGFQSLYDKIEQIYQLTKNDKVEKRLCHGACYDSNILIGIDNKMNLIDWEYSGNCDPANDLGTFICCSDYTYEEAVRVLEIYFERELTEEELRHYIAYIAIAAYYWFVWAIYQECLGNIVDKYVYMWYKYSKFYSEKALELYKD